ncbi:hypothetical protein P5W11_06660 [Mycobacteroides abscessus subsp. bolletii]|nr:hypothetical protein [Mycobacteroides abscessus]MDO3067891.1 hypothetical protein [Mycobacteroides abscessus subsp. bolletii]SLD43876.1 Uncharacterised protein [Mycobacteroides abscessus subsp. bolletii]
MSAESVQTVLFVAIPLGAVAAVLALIVALIVFMSRRAKRRNQQPQPLDDDPTTEVQTNRHAE